MEALVADERRFVRLLIGAPRLGVLPTNSLSSGGEIIGVCGENRPFLPQNSRYSPRTQRYSRLLHYVTAFCRGLAIVGQPASASCVCCEVCSTRAVDTVWKWQRVLVN